MTDATTTTVSYAAVFAAILDDTNRTMFARWVNEQQAAGSDMSHRRTCEDCAEVSLRQYWEVLSSRGNTGGDFASYIAEQRVIYDLATPPAPLVVPEDVDATIRAEFPGAIPDDKLAKLRTLIMENKALKAQLNGAAETLAQQADAPIDLNDKRLWPSFAKVAEAAEEEGYCNEYDRMSQRGGFPTRDELADAGLLNGTDYTAQVWVDVTITRRMMVPFAFTARRNQDTYDIAAEEFDDIDTETFESIADIPNGWNVENFQRDYINGVSAN
jgi:hypothetical protein